MDDQTDQPAKPPRDEKGRILPGHSLNPRGGNKPQILKDATGRKFDIQEFYTSNAGRVAYELYKIITDSATPATARISAIKEYNDRAFGRPAQTTIHKADDRQDSVYEVDGLSVDALRQIVHAKLIEGSKGDE